MTFRFQDFSKTRIKFGFVRDSFRFISDVVLDTVGWMYPGYYLNVTNSGNLSKLHISLTKRKLGIL